MTGKNRRTIRTQEEFDALGSGFGQETEIYIDGQDIKIEQVPNKSKLMVINTSSVVLMKDVNAVLRDHSTGILRNNTSANLLGYSSAILWEESKAELNENTLAVFLDKSKGVLRGGSVGYLWGKANAELFQNSVVHVKNADNTVIARENATVYSDYANVTIFDSATHKPRTYIKGQTR